MWTCIKGISVVHNENRIIIYGFYSYEIPQKLHVFATHGTVPHWTLGVACVLHKFYPMNCLQCSSWPMRTLWICPWDWISETWHSPPQPKKYVIECPEMESPVISTYLTRCRYHFLGSIEVTLMVLSNLCNDEDGMLSTDISSWKTLMSVCFNQLFYSGF